MADGINWSIAADADPFEFQNRLLANQKNQQEVQANNIKLATERFKTINDAAAGILSDPELGKTDVTKKLWDTLGRLTKGDAMTAQHAVQFMQQFPTDPQQQRQAIQNVHAQTLGAWERGKAYLGTVEGVGTGGGTKLIQQPAYGGAPPRQIGYIENTLQPNEKGIDSNPNSPNYGRETTMGVYGDRPIQLPPAAAPAAPVRAPRAAPAPAPAGAMPPVEGAPGRAKVPSSAKVVGDDEGVKSGIYDAPSFNDRFSAARPVTKLAPGEVAPLEAASKDYIAARDFNNNFDTAKIPLQMAIPLVEKLGKTGSGPGQETIQHIKAFAQTMGLPVPNEKSITNYAEAKKYLSQNAAMAAPPGTNVPSVVAAFESNPNLQQPNQATAELAKTLYGLARMRRASYLAFEDAQKKENLPANSYSKWVSKNWSNQYDVRGFMADLMTPEQRAELTKSVKPGTELAKRIRSSVDLAKKLNLFGDVERPEVK